MTIKNNITAIYVALILLTVYVISLSYDIALLRPSNTVYMQNTDSGYTTVDTKFGTFLVMIVESKALEDATELSLVIVNPVSIYFSDAKVEVQVGESVENIRMDVSPGLNPAQLKIPPIERGDSIKLMLELDKIEFKKMI